MNRRNSILALLALGTAVAPRIATPQSPRKIPTVGFLSSNLAPTKEGWDRTPFAIKLKELGWIEGKNILVERAYSEGRSDRLPALAAELVRKQVDVIYALGPDPSIDAARATRTIPIVSWGAASPVGTGLIDSHARPGRNVTGMAWSGSETYLKQLEFIRKIVPAATRIAFFSLPNALRTVSGGFFNEIESDFKSAAKSMGLEMRGPPVVNPEDFESAFRAIKDSRVQALFVATSPLTVQNRQKIIDFANTIRIPSFSDGRMFPEAGGFFSYGPEFSHMTAQAVGQIDRILRGAKPADLPMELPVRYELVVNRSTATNLGIRIPQEVLLRADRVIE